MNTVNNQELDNYMQTLTIDVKKDKIKEFYRYLDNPSKYFKYDSEKEIEDTKNIWAGYAYVILADKINGTCNINEQEEEFLSKYYEKMLSKHTLNKWEKEVKGLFIKYRLSKDYSYNNLVKLPLDTKNEDFNLGLNEFVSTLESIVSSIYSKNIKIDGSRPIYPDIDHKGSTINVSSFRLKRAYKNFLEDNYNIKCALDVVKEIVKVLELEKLEEAKSNEISERAVIYTLEDYLQSKASKKTKLANVYHSLYVNIIKNKQIIIDSNKLALQELNSINETFKDSIYNEIDEKFNEYLKEYNNDVNNMEHFSKDIKYFDINNLEKDGLSKLYDMYTKGLKAMPKTKLTNVTKYFALNGDCLTTIEMDAIIDDYKWKIKNAKKQDKKHQLKNEMDKIEKVMNFIKGISYSYTIEQTIRDMTPNYVNMDEILKMVVENYSQYQDVKYRLNRAYLNLDNFASSGSPTRAADILDKKRELLSALENCKSIDRCILRNEDLASRVEYIDSSKDIVIRKVKDYSRLITMLQEFTGRGITTCDAMLENSIECGTPIIKDVKPGFKSFMEEALALKGAQDFKKDKKKKR